MRSPGSLQRSCHALAPFLDVPLCAVAAKGVTKCSMRGEAAASLTSTDGWPPRLGRATRGTHPRRMLSIECATNAAHVHRRSRALRLFQRFVPLGHEREPRLLLFASHDAERSAGFEKQTRDLTEVDDPLASQLRVHALNG